jgi:predicted acylesterase/phospholipase RssA
MIHNLIISGGSTKTVAVVGCLKYLEEFGMLSGIVNYIGTSAGSILCLFLILGYKITEILEFLKKSLHLLNLDFDELLNFTVLDTFGLDSGANIERFVSGVVQQKLGRGDITFLELAKLSGKNFVVGVSNVTRQCQEYLDVDTAPHLSVIKAIRMSVSLPFIFTPVHHNGNLYVDGAVYESLPVGFINRFSDPLKDTLAINTRTRLDTKVASFGAYLNVLIGSVLDKANSLENISKKIKVFHIDFEDAESPIVNLEKMSFDLDEAKIQQSIEKGYAAIKRRFEVQSS